MVALAEQHLALGRDLVIARANSLLGPGRPRPPEALRRLWQALVDEFGPDSAPEVPALADEEPENVPAETRAVTRRSPVKATPVEAAPVEAAPVEAAPVEAAPVDLPAVPADDATNDPEASGGATGFDETTGADPVDSDGLDLDELIDASSHTDQVVELLNEAFPGAEIDAPAESRAGR